MKEEIRGKQDCNRRVYLYLRGKERHHAPRTFRYAAKVGGFSRSNALSLKKLWFIAPVTPEGLKKLLSWVKFAVFAGVVERNIGVGALFALVNLAGVEGLGVDVDAHCALVKLHEILDLMHGLQRIYIGGMCGVHVVNVGGNDVAGAAGGVALVDTKILHAEPPDGRGHPAILIAVIVDAAELADFPADSHALENVVLENEIAGVIALGEEEILFQRLRKDGVLQNVVLYRFQRELAVGHGCQALHPLVDGESLRRNFHLFLHVAPRVVPNRALGQIIARSSKEVERAGFCERSCATSTAFVK